MEDLGDKEDTASASTAATDDAKPQESRRKKRQAMLQRHFPKYAESEQGQPTVVQEEPATPVSPRVAIEKDRSSSTGRMTPLRRRTEVVPAALVRRREELILRLSQKKQRPESAPTTERVASRDDNENGREGATAKTTPKVVVNWISPADRDYSEKNAASTVKSVHSQDSINSTSVRSKGRLQRWNENKHKMPPSTVAMAARKAKQDDHTANEANDSFDMRSIVDYPPEPIRKGNERVAVAEDPTWDTARVYFSEFDRNDGRVNDEINMFVSESWTATYASFPSAEGVVQEEKKEKDPSYVEPVRYPPILPVNDDTLDPLGWPVQQDDFVASFSLDQTDENDTDAFDDGDDDNANLLAVSSDAVLTDSEDHSEGKLAKEERIEMYVANSRDDMSDSEGSDNTESADEDEEIYYVSQADVEDMDDALHQNDYTQDPLPDGFVSAGFATFDIAASAATAAAKSSTNGVHNSKQGSRKTKLGLPPRVKLTAAGPPPPPPGGRKKRNPNIKTGKANIVPLLSPPSEEKLKEWEKSKLRPAQHLQALKAKATDFKMIELNMSLLPSSASESVQADVGSTPDKSVRSAEMSYDQALSPASSAAVLQDTKMAEKVDHAISVAAMKFEEKLEEPIAEATEFQGGAFATWEKPELSPTDEAANADTPDDADYDMGPSEAELVVWLLYDVFRDARLAASLSKIPSDSREESIARIRFLLEDNKRFNMFCKFISDSVKTMATDTKIEPFSVPKRPDPANARALAIGFVQFLDRVSEVSSVSSPFENEKVFLRTIHPGDAESMQRFVFDHPSGGPQRIANFAFHVHLSLKPAQRGDGDAAAASQLHEQVAAKLASASPLGRRFVAPRGHPSPFETVVRQQVKIVSFILGFLGDPVAVCRMKMVNKTCYQFIDQNEHRLIRDAVRLGGLSTNARPAFWMWVTLQKSVDSPLGQRGLRQTDLNVLESHGRGGKWNHVIERDVSRAFGNLPPHKTGARLRTDSIIRALVTWGKSRMMKRGVKGSGDPPPVSHAGSRESDSDEVSLTPTDTVSDWGGVSPAGSFATGSFSTFSGVHDKPKTHTSRSSGKIHRNQTEEEMALSGNALTDDMKRTLQDKLSFILNALAAAHQDVGYCQGMDYIVAHLLRILQETVRWQAVRGELPSSIKSAPQTSYGSHLSEHELAEIYAEIDRSLVVEETCFRVMDSFLTTYNLRHFYWPELRCLKTCCLVFEKLIQIKLPVLADHFEHHELNVGLFALGWFQTLFLYLPSMPSATVCHMWDIWLVERSFKIFFRVATAILFLSQPILLNHELEGMMIYLNTFPDATLLNPDILIACALQIKVTNRMLMELEREISESNSPL